jgi:hypothetical protein
MRDELDNEMHTTSRRDSRLRRLGVPILAAATVAALAAGGYALFGHGGDRELAPAGGRDTVSANPTTPAPTRSQPPPTPHSTEEGTAKAKPEQPGQSRPVANAAQAYRACIGLVRNAGGWDGGAIKGLAGKVAVDNGKGITVVVANATDAYTCNVKPDTAVSYPRPIDSAVSPAAFTYALNATSNRLPDDPGDMMWAGGALPEGVTSVTYTFPDGHQERAAVKDGFWAMQYFSPAPLTKGSYEELDAVKVTVDGPAGKHDVSLVWGPDVMCNQVSHGC